MNVIITRNPGVMHGAPCFAGTRVEVRTFWDHLGAGYSIDEFLTDFPTVRREQIIGLLDHVRRDVERTAVVETA